MWIYEWRFNVFELQVEEVYIGYPTKSTTELFVIIAVSSVDRKLLSQKAPFYNLGKSFLSKYSLCFRQIEHTAISQIAASSKHKLSFT